MIGINARPVPPRRTAAAEGFAKENFFSRILRATPIVWVESEPRIAAIAAEVR